MGSLYTALSRTLISNSQDTIVTIVEHAYEVIIQRSMVLTVHAVRTTVRRVRIRAL